MEIGLHSAILGHLSFEDLINTLSEKGYQSVELCCWPSGENDRRYAGVSHVDVDNTSESYINYIKDYAKKKNIKIATLGYYPNPLSDEASKASASIDHIKKSIYFAHLLGVNKLSTFIGKNKFLSDDDNMILFKKVWPDIIKYAESLKVYVAIENCPMYFTKNEWPGGNNLASSPYLLKQIFTTIDSKYFGLAYDPSHPAFQRLDYLLPLYMFKDKLLHVHLKDIFIDESLLNQYGIFTAPLNYMDPRIPGRGVIDWKKFFETLHEIGYKNSVVIEVEDKSFEGNENSVLRSIEESLNHIHSVL